MTPRIRPIPHWPTHDALKCYRAITLVCVPDDALDGLYLDEHAPDAPEGVDSFVRVTATVLRDLEAAGKEGCDPSDYVGFRVEGGVYTTFTTPLEAQLVLALIDAREHLDATGGRRVAYVTDEVTGRVEAVPPDRVIDKETGEVRTDFVEYDAESAWLAATNTGTTSSDNHRRKSGLLALGILSGDL